jgi:hypothetical protein
VFFKKTGESEKKVFIKKILKKSAKNILYKKRKKQAIDRK